jgi:16S rRNA (uracil1498-N3)-methyltransferase
VPENRFFKAENFVQGKTCTLEGEELRHLLVMRRKETDMIELVNGRSQLAKATLLELTKKKALLQIDELISTSPPTRQVILAQSLLKPNNLELVIEKGTELGATAFWLFPAARSEKSSLTSQQKLRLEQLTISSLKQCGRLDLPPIIEHPPLKKWQLLPYPAYFGDPRAEKSLDEQEKGTSLLFFVGPEGGFTPEEEGILVNILKAKGIRLNPHILRAETAALCALAKIIGDLN